MKLSSILVVDDCKADQFLSRNILEREYPDAEILEACDGLEALELLNGSDKKIDLIILDINMPRMNGHEFLTTYNQMSGENKSSVVVMLTSSDNLEDKEKSMAYDFVVDYFIKSMDKDDLLKLKNL